MVSCLLKEWEVLSRHYKVESPVTIFFGGGTPSLLDVRNVELIVRNGSFDSTNYWTRSLFDDKWRIRLENKFYEPF